MYDFTTQDIQCVMIAVSISQSGPAQTGCANFARFPHPAMMQEATAAAMAGVKFAVKPDGT
jgi:hypothetical protein